MRSWSKLSILRFGDVGGDITALSVVVPNAAVLPVKVVAVQWLCRACDATAVGPPERLPEGWVELPPPPWRVQHAPSHACSDHAEQEGKISINQWSQYEAKTYAIDAADFERVDGLLRAARHQFQRLKFSGGRARVGESR